MIFQATQRDEQTALALLNTITEIYTCEKSGSFITIENKPSSLAIIIIEK